MTPITGTATLLFTSLWTFPTPRPEALCSWGYFLDVRPMVAHRGLTKAGSKCATQALFESYCVFFLWIAVPGPHSREKAMPGFLCQLCGNNQRWHKSFWMPVNALGQSQHLLCALCSSWEKRKFPMSSQLFFTLPSAPHLQHRYGLCFADLT